MMDGVAQAGFYRWEPNKIEDVLGNILEVAEKEEFCNSWDGEAPATASEIGLGDVLLLSDSDKHIRVGFEPNDQTDRRLNYFLNVSISVRHLTVDENKMVYNGFMAKFVNLIRQLSITIEPDYISIIHPDPDVGPSPLEAMPTEGEFEIERLPWLSVYSPSLLDQLGWTDCISDAPAWKVDQLDTGAVLLIKTQEPWADVSRDHPLDKHLLDGDDA
ncbi:hypothetical protein ACNO8S_19870 (plasmid) [Haloarcula sp. KBTZ06]|uniref:hypothetical protein n=1 Tax=Haloarcula sp. KBTZ06 TaxID=3402682 RepID=UPI003B43B19E